MLLLNKKDFNLIWDSLDKNIIDSMTALLNTEDEKRKLHLNQKIKNLNEMKNKMRGF